MNGSRKFKIWLILLRNRNLWRRSFTKNRINPIWRRKICIFWTRFGIWNRPSILFMRINFNISREVIGIYRRKTLRWSKKRINWSGIKFWSSRLKSRNTRKNWRRISNNTFHWGIVLERSRLMIKKPRNLHLKRRSSLLSIWIIILLKESHRISKMPNRNNQSKNLNEDESLLIISLTYFW